MFPLHAIHVSLAHQRIQRFQSDSNARSERYAVDRSADNDETIQMA